MQTTLSYWVLALVLCGFTARALDGEFYRQFLTLVDTNQVLLRRITSPVLVDTNNTGIKITNAVLNLNSLKQAGEISGMRLGISMDEVIGRWGKPTGGCSPGFIHPGLTTFFYSDIALGFEGDRLETVRIRPNFKFADGLSVTSKVG